MIFVKRLKKAKTKNIDFPSNTTSIGHFQDLYDNLMKWGYTMFDSDDYGAHGCFIYAKNEHNIYLIEIYFFQNKNKNRTLNEQAKQLGRHTCVLIEYLVDEFKTLTFQCIQKCPNYIWGDLFRDIQSQSISLDCCGEYVFLDTSDFNIAKELAQKIV